MEAWLQDRVRFCHSSHESVWIWPDFVAPKAGCIGCSNVSPQLNLRFGINNKKFTKPFCLFQFLQIFIKLSPIWLFYFNFKKIISKTDKKFKEIFLKKQKLFCKVCPTSSFFWNGVLQEIELETPVLVWDLPYVWEKWFELIKLTLQ